MPRDGVGDLGVGVGDLGEGAGDLAPGVGDLGTGVEAGVGLFTDGAGVWAFDGTGVGVLEGGAGDFADAGVATGVAVAVPSLVSGICWPCL